MGVFRDVMAVEISALLELLNMLVIIQAGLLQERRMQQMKLAAGMIRIKAAVGVQAVVIKGR